MADGRFHFAKSPSFLLPIGMPQQIGELPFEVEKQVVGNCEGFRGTNLVDFAACHFRINAQKFIRCVEVSIKESV